MDLLKWFKKTTQRALTYDQLIGPTRMLGLSRSGLAVNEVTALGLPALWCGVTNLASTTASLPLEIYQFQKDGTKESLPTHPAWKLLNKNPNSFMGSYTFRKTMTACRLLHGNAFAEIIRTNGGKVQSLLPIHPTRIQIKVSGTIATYVVDGTNEIDDEDMFHLSGLSLDGLIGLHTLQQARDALGISIATDRFTSAFYRNNTMATGYLYSPVALSDQARNNMEESWNKEYASSENAFHTPLLEAGTEFKQISQSPEDSQLNETRVTNDKMIAQILNIPLVFLKSLDRATWGNYDQEMEFFVQHSLRDHCIGWEEEIQRKLIMPSEQDSIFAEHNVDNLLRGKTLERYQAYALALSSGWLTKDEVRHKEHLAPIPDEEPTVMDSDEIPNQVTQAVLAQLSQPAKENPNAQ